MSPPTEGGEDSTPGAGIGVFVGGGRRSKTPSETDVSRVQGDGPSKCPDQGTNAEGRFLRPSTPGPPTARPLSWGAGDALLLPRESTETTSPVRLLGRSPTPSPAHTVSGRLANPVKSVTRTGSPNQAISATSAGRSTRDNKY